MFKYLVLAAFLTFCYRYTICIITHALCNLCIQKYEDIDDAEAKVQIQTKVVGLLVRNYIKYAINVMHYICFV